MTELMNAVAVRKLGGERFRDGDRELELSLLDFWQWSTSDLVGNSLRGLLAEYIVAAAMDCHNGCRREWDAYDMKTAEGITVEVKSSAYVQSWKQRQDSVISFMIPPTTGWNAETNEYSLDRRRQAHVYVFCVLKNRDRATIDPLDLAQWDFYVLPSRVLDERVGAQKTIRLNPLLRLDPAKVAYSDLRQAVLAAGRAAISAAG